MDTDNSANLTEFLAGFPGGFSQEGVLKGELLQI
jgi:hypothetical protein